MPGNLTQRSPTPMHRSRGLHHLRGEDHLTARLWRRPLGTAGLAVSNVCWLVLYNSSSNFRCFGQTMQSGEALLSLSDAGSWASLASLAISICSLLVSSYAALGIRRVRIDLINRATLSALSKALDRHVNVLRGNLQDYERSKNDFEAELVGCGVNLTSIQEKVADTTKVNVYPLQWKIARYKGQFLFSRKEPEDSERDARAIFNDLLAIQQQLNNFLEDQRLGG